MREIVLRLKATLNWVSDATEGSPTTVRVLDCKPAGQGSIQQLVELNTPNERLEKAIGNIKNNPMVEDVYMTSTQTGRGMGRILSKHAVACRGVMDSELFCRSCLFTSKPNADGTAEWTLAFPDGRSLTRFLKRLEKDKINVDIRRLSKVLDRKNLTPRQQQIIQHALDRGYFDYPRKVDLSSLADELKVSKSTLGEILRRGEKKALSSLYGRDADRFSSIPVR